MGVQNVRGLAGKEVLIQEFEKTCVFLLLLSKTKMKGKGIK